MKSDETAVNKAGGTAYQPAQTIIAEEFDRGQHVVSLAILVPNVPAKGLPCILESDFAVRLVS